MYDQSRISRTPYPPIGVGPLCPRRAQNSVRHHLVPQRKLRSPKFKYEALEISEVRSSGVTRGLIQGGGQNLAEGGPLLTVGAH